MSRSALARLGLLGFIWGCSFLFIKVALEGLSPPQVVFGRVATGAAAVLLVLRTGRGRLPSDRVVWFHLAAFSLIGNILPFLLFAWGEQRISSSRAGVLDATAPLFTLVVAMLWLPEERPTMSRVLGLLLGFAGVVIVVGPWTDQGGGQVSGQLACLLASALYGLGFVYTAKFVSGRGLAPPVLAATQLVAGTLILGVAMPFIGRQPMQLSARVMLCVVTLGAVNTGLAYLIYHGLMREAGATSTSLVTYLVPVAAVALGVVVLDEPLTWNLFAGASVVILGIAVAEGRLRRRRPAGVQASGR